MPPSEVLTSRVLVVLVAFTSRDLAPGIKFPLLGPAIGLTGIIELGLKVTLAPGLVADAPRIEGRALLEVGLRFGKGRRLDVDALALEAPTSLIVGACVGVGARLEAEGGIILVEVPKASFEGCRLISGCFLSIEGAYKSYKY